MEAHQTGRSFLKRHPLRLIYALAVKEGVLPTPKNQYCDLTDQIFLKFFSSLNKLRLGPSWTRQLNFDCLIYYYLVINLYNYFFRISIWTVNSTDISLISSSYHGLIAFILGIRFDLLLNSDGFKIRIWR